MAPGVAHEDCGAALWPQVEREEAGARKAEREGEDQDGVVLVLGQCVDREVAARDDGERRRQAVHVVQQVERVRDPDQPEQPDRPREYVVADDLDAQAAGQDDHRCRDLSRELGDRAQVPEVVDEPGNEDDRDAREDPAELAAPLDGARCERQRDSRHETGKDADAAEGGCRLCVPTRVRRLGDEPRADRRAKQKPENRGSNRKRGDRHDRNHNRERVVEHPVALHSSRCPFTPT